MDCIKVEENSFSDADVSKNGKKSINQIYTEWANHYLDKGRSKRRISDLQVDVTDGIILADVIEAVTGQKVSDINRKPKNSSQMLENVASSLSFLEKIGVQCDGLTPKDIKDGNLKAILSLFFALSRYKQEQKQALQERRELQKLREKRQESEQLSSSRFGSPYKQQPAVGSAIPTPASKRPPSADHQSRNFSKTTSASPAPPVSVSTKLVTSTSSSRSTSPSAGNGSFIPTVRTGSRSSDRHKSSASRVGARSQNTSSVNVVQASPNTGQHAVHKHKDSMLDKFKLFSSKEKEYKNKTSNSATSKRTSSSSGFSSARSERSDSSSTSLCPEVKPPPLPPHQHLPESNASSSSGEQVVNYFPHLSHSTGKSPGLKGIRSRFSRGGRETKESSPKTTRKSEERDHGKGSPRSSHRLQHKNSDLKETRTDRRGNESRKPEHLTLDLYSVSRCVSPIYPDRQNRNTKVASLTPSNQYPPMKNVSYDIKKPPTPALSQSLTPNSPLSSSGSSTGIPKPTAAVKGTSKVVLESKSPSPNVNTPTAPKEYQNKVLRTPIVSQKKVDSTKQVECRDSKNSLPRQRNLGGKREDSGHTPSVAMVSPMPVSATNNVPLSESGSTLSEISQNSSRSNSNSSGNSSVIFKPAGSSDDSRQDKLIKREIQEMVFKNDDGEDIVLDIKPMQPLARTTQCGYMRGMVGMSHHAKISSPSLHVSHLVLQENSNTVPQKGMKMAASHLKRQIISGSPKLRPIHTDSEYSDVDSNDLPNGYVSDGGEALERNIALQPYNHANLEPDGYLSEGGASLYSHRLSQRFKEGMRQVHESMNKVHHFIQDDSFDDSSSLSSGISDTLNELSEDLLSSPYAPEQNSALAKAKGVTDVGLKLPVGLCGSTAKKAHHGMDLTGAYKIVSSKAQVKKTEITQHMQQTSSLRSNSNSFLQKCSDNSRVNLERGDFRRNMDIVSATQVNRSDHKKINFVGIMPNSSTGNYGAVINPALGKMQEKKVLIAGKKELKDRPAILFAQQLNGQSKKVSNIKTTPCNFAYGPRRASTGASNHHKVNGRIKHEAEVIIAKDSTSHSLDRPRTKVKVSGGTQTTSDLQYMPTAGFHSDGEYSSSSLGRKYQQLKSYSLNGPAASQLSQGVRDRILQSPYRKVHQPTECVPYVPNYYRERSPRIKHTDGSLSDTPYLNYAEIQYSSNNYGAPYSWVTRNSYSPASKLQSRIIGEADSLESLSSTNSSLLANQLQQNRPPANSNQGRIGIHQKEITASASPRLARSNSVSHLIERTFPRSTKCEKVLGFRDGYHSSQPTSPTPLSSSRLSQSPMTVARSSPYYSSRSNKEDDCHGSSLSLVSSSSSIYSSQEEKHNAEIRKVKRDLSDAQEKVHTLTNQLTTNAHVVAAFEQSLTSMTNRLQQLAASSEQKDSEVMGLRKTIDALRQQSVDAGLTVACLQSENLVRGTSIESVSSLSSVCSTSSFTSGQDKSDLMKAAKKKGWLRSSFTKAFSRNAKIKKNPGCSSDVEECKEQSDSTNNSFLHDYSVPQDVHSEDISSQKEENDEVEVLKRQLWEKDMVLTDIRLEALTSAHQLDSLKEALGKVRGEMKTIKEDNDRLQLMMSAKNLDATFAETDRRMSMAEDIEDIDDTTDVLLIDPLDKESKRVTISVVIGCETQNEKFLASQENSNDCVIGAISVNSRTKWDILDNLVKRIFKEFLLRIDPISNLGMSCESILSYHLGEVHREKDSKIPELLPCGYFVGEVASIRIILKGASIGYVDGLAFQSLVPKSVLQRYISLLSEHRRIILCGPSGTGKTFLAKKLAEFLVCRLGKDPSPGHIATFSIDHKTGKNLGGYLAHISEQCESNVLELPSVIILDNLHHAGTLTEVFNGFLSVKYSQCPFIIGTMNQTTNCSTTNLQLHHNFRWVLMANHMEPVKGLLARISRRKLTEVEVRTTTRQTKLQQILDWIPKCWIHINKFLETHSSSDVTIGPRLFLSCPSSVAESQLWFSDLWNYSLVPYVIEAIKEGLQLYGKRASWQDPTSWINETYPWNHNNLPASKALISLQPEDVGFHSTSSENIHKKSEESSDNNDPLISMLLRLQEATNMPSPHRSGSPLVPLENIDSALESTL